MRDITEPDWRWVAAQVAVRVRYSLGLFLWGVFLLNSHWWWRWIKYLEPFQSVREYSADRLFDGVASIALGFGLAHGIYRLLWRGLPVP